MCFEILCNMYLDIISKGDSWVRGLPFDFQGGIRGFLGEKKHTLIFIEKKYWALTLPEKKIWSFILPEKKKKRSLPDTKSSEAWSFICHNMIIYPHNCLYTKWLTMTSILWWTGQTLWLYGHVIDITFVLQLSWDLPSKELFTL